ncbi:MAG: sirohydrochlorin cobaltochelatase [Bacillota bacterium]|nr:sirohydrochlorin cobaltochelatase [Bacillota bacterium]
MKKKFKKLLSVITALAVAATMTSATVSLSYAGETGDPEPQSDVTTTLGMFTPENAKVTINDDATASVEFTVETTGATKCYDKIALVEQTAEDKDSVAIEAVVDKTEGGSSTFRFTVEVSKLGKQIPFSTHRIKTDGTEEWKSWSEQKYIIFNSPSIVDQMISKIYVQTRNEYTDAMCEAAKACWDGLLDEQKKLVQEYDYFGLDTGDASNDNTLNQNEIGEKELLVVSFGTSFNDSRAEDIGSIEKALADAYPGYSVRRAFTSQIIINHIQARDGYAIDNVTQAMDRAVANGVKQMVVQPTHLMSGYEYDDLKAEINEYANKIDIVYGKPLLDSDADRTTVAKAVTKAAALDAGYSSITTADENTAFVFLGHGTSHENQKRYTQMQQKFEALGYSNCFMGTVEGKPEATSIESIIATVKADGYTKVVLRPLMVVAGDHAENDMAGDDEDSWKNMFVAAGFKVECQINGLGVIEAIQNVYVQHANTALENKASEVAKAEAEAEKATAEKARIEAEKSKAAAEKARVEAEQVIKTLNAKLTVMGTKVAGVKVKAYKSSHKITVKWAKNSKVTGYKIYRATSLNGKYKLVKTTTGKSVTIKKHKKGKTYYYKVVGYKKIAGKTIYTKDSAIKKIKAK